MKRSGFRLGLSCLFATFILISGCRKKITPPEITDEISDWSPLLNDDELGTRADPNAAFVNPEWADWIIDNHEPIRSLLEDDFRDLQFLKDLIGDRRLVQLGESGHGVMEFNEAKVRLIKFLHQEMGFNVIAFESGVFSCNHVNIFGRQRTSLNLMRSSIFGVWHTAEVLPLFTYIKSNHGTIPPLQLAGCDVQFSSGYVNDNRPEFFREIISSIDSAYAEIVFQVEEEFFVDYFDWNNRDAYVLAHGDSLKTFYREVTDFFDLHMSTLLQTYSHDPRIPQIARQSAWSTEKDVGRALERAMGNSSENYHRDKGMADNVDFLMDILYPGEKIMIWAHNGHIRHHNTEMRVRVDRYKCMGAYLYDRHRDNLYTIGLYMYRGQAAMNNRTVYDIYPATDNSLEAIMYQTRRKYCFVDMLHQNHVPGTRWMSEYIVAKGWGTQPWEMKLKDQYDGILFIHTTHPPDYIPWGSIRKPVFPLEYLNAPTRILE